MICENNNFIVTFVVLNIFWLIASIQEKTFDVSTLLESLSIADERLLIRWCNSNEFKDGFYCSNSKTDEWRLFTGAHVQSLREKCQGCSLADLLCEGALNNLKALHCL